MLLQILKGVDRDHRLALQQLNLRHIIDRLETRTEVGRIHLPRLLILLLLHNTVLLVGRCDNLAITLIIILLENQLGVLDQESDHLIIQMAQEVKEGLDILLLLRTTLTTRERETMLALKTLLLILVSTHAKGMHRRSLNHETRLTVVHVRNHLTHLVLTRLGEVDLVDVKIDSAENRHLTRSGHFCC